MNYCYITFRSITYGQQGERLMQSKKIQSVLLRTPGWMEKKGCGYCLRLRSRDAEEAVRILRENGVDFRRVYRNVEDGSWKEMAL